MAKIKKSKKTKGSDEALFKLKLTNTEVAMLKIAFDSFERGIDDHVKKMIEGADESDKTDAEEMGDEMIMDVAVFKVKVENIFRDMLLHHAKLQAAKAGLDINFDDYEIKVVEHVHDENCMGDE